MIGSVKKLCSHHRLGHYDFVCAVALFLYFIFSIGKDGRERGRKIYGDRFEAGRSFFELSFASECR